MESQDHKKTSPSDMSTNEDTTDDLQKAVCQGTSKAKVKRRRDMYKQIPCDKKEELLSRRRTRRVESYSEVQQHNAPILRHLLPLQEGATSQVTKVSATLDKDQNMLGNFSVFEIGSTSGTCASEYGETSLDVITNKGCCILRKHINLSHHRGQHVIHPMWHAVETKKVVERVNIKPSFCKSGLPTYLFRRSNFWLTVRSWFKMKRLFMFHIDSRNFHDSTPSNPFGHFIHPMYPFGDFLQISWFLVLSAVNIQL